MSDAIELLQVTKCFGKQAAVDGLDLKVPTGSIYGFIGPNGSGKTTTLRMILRIYQPDSGIVRVLGARAARSPTIAWGICQKSAAYTNGCGSTIC